MKNKARVFISAVLAALMTFSGINVHAAESDILYEKTEERTLTRGIVYKEIERLYKSGWMDIYVIEIDAHDENVGMKVLESAAELGGKHTVSDFASTYKVKAAVNADFFGSGNPQSSLGQVARGGQMESARNYYNGSENKYAGFWIDNENTPFIDYVKSTIGFFGAGEVSLEMEAKNKYTDFDKPVYFDRNAISTTASLDSHRSDLVKIVVSEGAISQISSAGETVEVPQDGYIIVMSKASAAANLSKFYVGQRVSFSENENFVFRPEKDISSLKLGISGGGELLRNGEIVENGLIISGRNPRTMIGVNKDKTKVYVVCVDGRGDSIGATHYEAAEIMSSLGCYDAIHFDGGGSTTMVVEDEDKQLYVANDPSEGTQRRVANAFGVAGIGESSTPASLKLSLDGGKNIMFNGFGTAINVKGLDEYLNPIGISGDIEYSADIAGEWNGNVFTPAQEGECTITAKLGDIQGSLKVKVLGGAASLGINIGSGGIGIGESAELNVNVINEDGYAIPADNSKVVWTVDDPETAYIQDGRIYGKNSGTAVVTAECNGASASLKISVGTRYAQVMSFEASRKLTVAFSGESVSGTASQVKGVAADGNKSISVSYAFAGNMTTTQSVFAELANGIPMPADTRDISFMYKGGGSGVQLKAIITDANDKSYGMLISEELSGDEWKKATAAVPKDAVAPIELKKLCVETLNTTDALQGTVYIDNIGAVIGGRAEAINNGIADPARGDLSSISGEEITIFGQTKTGTKGDAFTNLLERMHTDSNMLVFTGASDISGADAVWQNEYGAKESANFSVLMLASGSGSLRSNGSEQLRYFRDYINNMSKRNVIVCLDKDLLSSTGITDAREREAIMDILREAALEHDRNIIVVSGTGTNTEVTLKDGIRFVNLAGLSETELKYLRVKGNSDDFRYEIE